MNTLITTKSFWLGVSAVIGGAGGLATGSLNPVEGLQTVAGGLGLIFVRDAIRKVAR